MVGGPIASIGVDAARQRILKDEKRDDVLVEILRRSFPALANLSIRFDEASDRYISVTYKEQGRPKEFDVFSAGSGFQQFGAPLSHDDGP